jgi:hypothetical protein
MRRRWVPAGVAPIWQFCKQYLTARQNYYLKRFRNNGPKFPLLEHVAAQQWELQVPIVVLHCWNIFRKGPRISVQEWPKTLDHPRATLVQRWPRWKVVNNSFGVALYSEEYTFPVLFLFSSLGLCGYVHNFDCKPLRKPDIRSCFSRLTVAVQCFTLAPRACNYLGILQLFAWGRKHPLSEMCSFEDIRGWTSPKPCNTNCGSISYPLLYSHQFWIIL